MQVISPLEVERMLVAIGDDLESLTEEYARAEDRLAHAEAAHKRAWLMAYHEATGSNPVKEKRADVECMDEWEDKNLRTTMVRILKEKMRTSHARLDVARTLAANLRKQT